jgi:hypothetical protein
MLRALAWEEKDDGWHMFGDSARDDAFRIECFQSLGRFISIGGDDAPAMFKGFATNVKSLCDVGKVLRWQSAKMGREVFGRLV